MRVEKWVWHDYSYMWSEFIDRHTIKAVTYLLTH